MPRKPLPHNLAAQADRLSLEDLKLLVSDLNQKISDRELREKLDQPPPEDGWRSEYRTCGNPIVVMLMGRCFTGRIGIDRSERAIEFLNNTGVRDD